jgi:hypothetical protein
MIVLYVILAGLAVLFIWAAFAPARYTIEREIVINKPQSEVFNYVKLLKNQDYYSKWVMTDPSMKKDFTGADGTVGFIYAWDSENKQAGKGAQEIIKLTGNGIETEVRFEKPFKGVAHTALETRAISPNETKTLWKFIGDKTYMMKVMHLLLNLQKVLGKDMQTSLITLKNNLEE